MKIARPFIVISLLFFYNVSVSQNLDKRGREFFILGTLRDYMGRQQDPRDSSLFDRYYVGEDRLVMAIDSILKCDYPSDIYHINKHIGRDSLATYQIFSSKLVKTVDAYYNFEQSGSSTVSDDPDLNHLPILTGRLKENIFKNDNDKLAFLAGVYVRFGRPNDTSFLISMGNSLSKTSVCLELLKEFNCKPSLTILYNIPTIFQVYFHPNEMVGAYLKNYMYLRKGINDDLESIDRILYKKYNKQIPAKPSR